jgi:NosR/NirI family nitrous oxide reductase transcriptional regulator
VLTARHLTPLRGAPFRSNLARAMQGRTLPSVKPSVLLTILLVSACVALAGSESADATLQAQLKQLFPAASTFSPKGGDPPHFKAFSNDPRTGLQTLLGFAFWTTELAPLERGYDGPIKILVGLDPKGILTGIVVADHHEPYGSFSIDPPRFPAQFKGKDIRDAFKVGADVDAVSRATISITSASRAIRYSSRQVARQLLAPPQAQK